MKHQILEPEQKALETNLDTSIYGTFAEIGAGQEVARFFFKVGAAAGTIAKTVSAYDKVVSDNIYGVEASGRYVCESRLYKMLDHEFDLLDNRLKIERIDTKFFVFADTVAAINYTKTIKGNGWLGLRFQLAPDREPNDFVLHVRMKDNDNNLQQQAVGILGVNMIYACYNYYKDPQRLIVSLMDNLKDRVEIDMVRMQGPDFPDLDNRLLSLWLVTNGLTNVTMFGPDKKPVHPSEFLYKKDILIVRGRFRPPTLVNMDMMKSSWDQFKKNQEKGARGSFLLSEITTANLMQDDKVDEKDFLDRADLLAAMGQTVIISGEEEHSKMIRYFTEHSIRNIGIVIGVQQLLDLLISKYYENVDGSLLATFGKLFSKNVQVMVYPAKQEGSGEIMNASNMPVPEGIKFLFQHLLDSRQVVNVEDFKESVLHIFSPTVLEMIRDDSPGWDKLVTPLVAKMIRDNQLLGFPATKIEFNY